MKINIKGTIVPNNHKWIYDLYGIESVSPQDIEEGIKNADNGKLDIYINSGGGDVISASEIYSQIRSYTGEKQIHISGIAGSAATVIACACSSEITPSSLFMIHNASSEASGDYHDMDKTSDLLKTVNKSITEAYTAKTKKSTAELLELMDKETWMTANEAVENGFVDRISVPAENIRFTDSICAAVLPQAVIEKEIRNKKIREVSALNARLKLLNLGGKYYE